MNEIKLLNSCMPVNLDIQPTLQHISDKSNFPDINPEDDGITEFSLPYKTINWQAVRQEIDYQIKSNPRIAA